MVMFFYALDHKPVMPYHPDKVTRITFQMCACAVKFVLFTLTNCSSFPVISRNALFILVQGDTEIVQARFLGFSRECLFLDLESWHTIIFKQPF